MAGRTRNRIELRKQADQAEQQPQQEVLATAEIAGPTPKKRRAARVPKDPNAPKAPRKPRAPKAPPRMRARWCIYDGAMKPVAIFDYNQRAAADAKLADLAAKPKGVYFMQILKEPMIDSPPATILV